MKKDDKIVILGVTGYVGSWLAHMLSDRGFTNIHGTYGDSQKFEVVKNDLPNLTGERINILTEKEKLAMFMRDAKWIFNDSAPFTGEEKTIEDFNKTKINAVDNLFDAILENQATIRKLVHVGSAGAVGFGNRDINKKIITENDWSDIENLDRPYDKFVIMKTMEEREVWKLAKKFDVSTTVVHPTNVIGPSATPWQHDMIYSYLHNGTFIANGAMDSIDVRDLADLQIALMEEHDADQKRVLGIGFSISFEKLISITKNYLSGQDITSLFGQLPVVVPSDEVLALWEPFKNTSYYMDNAYRILNNTVVKTKYPEFYKYRYTDASETIESALQKMKKDSN